MPYTIKLNSGTFVALTKDILSRRLTPRIADMKAQSTASVKGFLDRRVFTVNVIVMVVHWRTRTMRITTMTR